MLPEVREADAPPHIAEIYADIRELAALPQVNLIFRYLATKPGALEWVWTALRPLYRSEQLAQAAATLMRTIERPGPSPLSAALTGDDLAACTAVLASYNSGNPQNILALTALIHAIRQPEPATAPINLTPRKTASAAQSIPFPPLPRRDELSPQAMARIEQMAARHPRAPGVVPSMYLHLALWPAALEAADIYLQPIIESPAWAPLVASVIHDAGQTAARLAPAIKLAGQPSETADLHDAIAIIEAFINQTIPELITVGRLLAIE